MVAGSSALNLHLTPGFRDGSTTVPQHTKQKYDGGGPSQGANGPYFRGTAGIGPSWQGDLRWRGSRCIVF